MGTGLVLPMGNAQPYFSPQKFGQNMCIVHGKPRCVLNVLSRPQGFHSKTNERTNKRLVLTLLELFPLPDRTNGADFQDDRGCSSKGGGSPRVTGGKLAGDTCCGE